MKHTVFNVKESIMSVYPYFDEVKKAVGAYGFRIESIRGRHPGSVRLIPETTQAIMATAGVDKKWMEFDPFRLEDFTLAEWSKKARMIFAGDKK